MSRFMLTFVAVLFSTPVCFASDHDTIPRPPDDLFGKPLPHGKTIDGSFFGISLSRTNLYFGQPLLVKVFSASATEWEDLLSSFEIDQIFDFEMRDEAGKHVRCQWDANYHNSEGDLVALKPPPTHAFGQHWKPGKYSLRAKLTIKEEITQPLFPIGTFSSNELSFTIHPPGHPLETTVPLFRKDLKKEDYCEDFWVYVSGLDDKVSRKLCRELEYNSKLWQLHIATFGPIHFPQNRNRPQPPHRCRSRHPPRKGRSFQARQRTPATALR